MRKSRSSTARHREPGSACEGKILARNTEVTSRPFVSDQGCISLPGDEAKSVRITNQGLQGFHEPRATACKVFHESRNTYFIAVLFAVGAQGSHLRKPPSGALRPSTSHGFPVHDCSRLFTIVRHCGVDPKNETSS